MSKKTSSRPEPDHVPASINPRLRQRRRREHPVGYYVEGILNGDRVVLSQAITLVESTRLEDQSKAREIVETCLPHSGRSFRLGITGVPGVGKSTFIETFGLNLLEEGKKVAILAVDPTSQLSSGSILGDKTRMAELSLRAEAFIRPSPAGASLGGVAAKTRELILLCEAAGYDFIIVETVGVGQSEVAVYNLTDFFLLLLLPGAGDELQGIKRGVVEMADLIAVNKADDERRIPAQQARAAYQRALHLFPPKASEWIAKAQTCSALSGAGLQPIKKELEAYHQLTQENGFFAKNRQEQAIHWFQQQLRRRVLTDFLAPHEQQITALETAIRAQQLSPQAAVESIFNK